MESREEGVKGGGSQGRRESRRRGTSAVTMGSDGVINEVCTGSQGPFHMY